MNVLCLGSEVVGAELAADLVRAFLARRVRRRRALRQTTEEDRGNGESTCLSHGCTSWRARAERLARLPLARHPRAAASSRAMMDEDAVVGVTSNPTIFQKALAEGDAYDEQLKELLGARGGPARRSSSQLSAERHRGGAASCCAASGTATGGTDGYVSWEVDPELAYDRRAHVRGGEAPARVDRRAEPLREDPGDRAAASARSRTRSPTAGHQRHADLLAAAPRRGDGGVPPRARASRRERAATCRRCTASRRSSSRASTPRRTGASTRPAIPS